MDKDDVVVKADSIDCLLAEIQKLRDVLNLVLDQADYTVGNCRVNEQVGAVLPANVIARARKALK